MDVPLDGDEGELVVSEDIDDEACFCFVDKSDTGADKNGYDRGLDYKEPGLTFVTGIDIVSLLPPEISVFIFSLLPQPRTRGFTRAPHTYGWGLQDILTSSLVCHNWSRLSNDNAIWRRAYAQWWGEPTSPQPVLQKHWKPLFMRRIILDERWTQTSFQPPLSRLVGHEDSVYTVEYCRVARLFVSGSRDRTIRIWDSRTHACLAILGTPKGYSGADGEGHSGSVLCLKLMRLPTTKGARADAFLMVSGSSDRNICVWTFEVEREGAMSPVRASKRRRLPAAAARSPRPRGVTWRVVATLRGHADGVLDLRLVDTANGKWIVSCSKDSTIRVWNRETMKEHRVLRGHDGPVNAVGVQDTRIVSASGDGKMILWNIDSGERLRTFEGHERGLACIEFKDDTIISGSNDCKIKVWSAATGECLRTLSGHSALVRALSYDSATGRLVSASYDRTIKVWDSRFVGQIIREFKGCHTSHIFDVQFDAGQIVTTSHDRKITILDFSEDHEDLCLL
ncbi:WD40 repeat-like protein [Fistulina hepatica ATCC 64428]|uniref:WD40 repeat-like protein n=1 Tax=Fistulina hepatica ATCC 64428 TaxID=1128425 RepID=A0A0D7AG19_9AGAR|nr:WD40 repeat-like protein [Fistulina hepatica ATCC 64428]